MNHASVAAQQRRSPRVQAIGWLLMFAFLSPAGVYAQATGAHQNVPAMTQNLYLGADLTPLFKAGNVAAIFTAAASIWTDVQKTDIPARAAKIADKIAAAEPDLVGLQEAEQWWFGATPDSLAVQFDFLQSILDELAARGAHYILSLRRSVEQDQGLTDARGATESRIERELSAQGGLA